MTYLTPMVRSSKHKWECQKFHGIEDRCEEGDEKKDAHLVDAECTHHIYSLVVLHWGLYCNIQIQQMMQCMYYK